MSQKSQFPIPKLKKYDSIKGMKEQIFKPYQQRQPMLLPPNLEEMIPPGHIVRVVSTITEGINIQPLIKQYKGGGTSAYHPIMMLKVIIYAYTTHIFFPANSKSLERKHILHVAERNEPARSSNNQPISRRDHEIGG